MYRRVPTLTFFGAIYSSVGVSPHDNIFIDISSEVNGTPAYQATNIMIYTPFPYLSDQQ
jgi:hypothetical protein